MKAVRVLGVWVLLAVLPALSNATRWQTYTESDGVPAGMATDMVQVPDGSIWVTSPGGIARIDRRAIPSRWETISTEAFDVLEVDSDGTIWAAGVGGRVQWFDVDGNALSTPVVIPSEDVVALDAGANGVMWIGQGNHLRRWTSTLPGGVAEEWMLPGSPTDARVLHLEETPLGNVWVGMARGIAYFENGSFTLTFLPGSGFGADQFASALHVLENDDVIVGTGSGKAYVYFRQVPSFSAEIFNETGSQRPPVEDITRDGLGRVWFARKEAIRFDPQGDLGNPGVWSRTILGADAGLNGDILYRIIESSPFVGTAGANVGAREMWFANDLGVSVQSGFPWTNWRTDTGGLAGDECFVAGDCDVVQGIIVDQARDEVWFGARWGLSRLRSGSMWAVWKNTLFGGPLIGTSIDAMHLDDDGRFWVASSAVGATPAGLQFHNAGDPDNMWMTVGQNEDRWRVQDMTRDAAGFLWLATHAGAIRLDTSGMMPVEDPIDTNGVPAGILQAVATDDAHVFVAAASGIGRFDLSSGTWTNWPINDLQSALPTRFNDLHVQNGRLYAGTDAGMIIVPVDANSLSQALVLSAASSVPGGFANDVQGIADGGNGTVLAATLSGLYRVNEALQRTGRTGVRDGLPEEELLCIWGDGDEVWIGTAGDGASAHRFEAPETALIQPPSDVVTSTAAPVVVVVAGADSDSPNESLRYQFRINDGNWQEPVTGPNISFVPAAFGLEEGMHVLQVRAIDSGLIADGTPAMAAFDIDITPPNPQVTSPTEGAAIRGVVSIVGTTEDLEDGRFQAYTVRVRPRDDPQATPTIVQPATTVAVIDATVATWDTTTHPDDWYVLEVVVADNAGVLGVQRLQVLVDNVAPFVEETSPVRALGIEGATVYTAAGDAAVVVPAFAFEGERRLTIERRADAGAAGGFAYDLGPDGLALNKLSTLQIKLPPSVQASSNLAIHRFDNGTWTPLGGTLESRVDGQFYAVGVDQMGSYSLRTADTQPTGGNVISNMQAEPRHFKPRTGASERVSVSFVLSRPTPVKAMVYNRAGRPRRVLVDGAQLGSGQQVIYWDGRDREGKLVASALYIIVVEAGGERVTKVVTVGHD